MSLLGILITVLVGVLVYLFAASFTHRSISLRWKKSGYLENHKGLVILAVAFLPFYWILRWGVILAEQNSARAAKKVEETPTSEKKRK